MQVQDAQKALISDTAIHSKNRRRTQMSAYTHFTPIERGHLAASLKGGKAQACIAAELGRSESTISRDENRRKVCRRPHKLDDPEPNARGKRLSVGRRSRSSTACFTKTAYGDAHWHSVRCHPYTFFPTYTPRRGRKSGLTTASVLPKIPPQTWRNPLKLPPNLLKETPS